MTNDLEHLFLFSFLRARKEKEGGGGGLDAVIEKLTEFDYNSLYILIRFELTQN